MLYDVDTKRIDKQISCLEECIAVATQLKNTNSLIEQFALQRSIHISIESIIDIGSVLIDGFIMRDPGGYLDIVEILTDEGVLSEKLSNQIKGMVPLRDKLVRNYDELQLEDLLFFIQETSTIELFIEEVRRYLEKELV